MYVASQILKAYLCILFNSFNMVGVSTGRIFTKTLKIPLRSFQIIFSNLFKILPNSTRSPSYTKWGRIIHKMRWSEKIKIKHISGLIVLSFISLSLLYAKYRNISKLSCRPLAFTLYKAFLKNKKGSASYPAWFLKNISLAAFYYLTKLR